MIQRTWLGVGVVAMSLAASGPVLAQQSGFRADADFLSSLSECLESEVHVFVRGGTNGGGKIEASVVQIDHCQGETLLDARAEANLAAGAQCDNVTLDHSSPAWAYGSIQDHGSYRGQINLANGSAVRIVK